VISMPRPQFTLKTMLWLIALVACFFAGFEVARRRGAEDRDNLLRVLQNKERALREITHENTRLFEMLEKGTATE